MIPIAALAIASALMAWNSWLDYRKFKLELEYEPA